MILITGPLYSGKKTYVKERFGWTDTELAEHAVWDVQNLAGESEDLEKLSASSQVGIEVVIEYEDGTTESRFIDLY